MTRTGQREIGVVSGRVGIYGMCDYNCKKKTNTEHNTSNEFPKTLINNDKD